MTARAVPHLRSIAGAGIDDPRLLASITTTDPDPGTPVPSRPVHPHTPAPDH
jgi:hypothetical protein